MDTLERVRPVSSDCVRAYTKDVTILSMRQLLDVGLQKTRPLLPSIMGQVGCLKNDCTNWLRNI
jgi:hypothetical protein